jgi:hypothetical protein
MALNWLEDVVSHLYRLKGYLVVENEDLQMPQTKSRRVRGHSDIDVMAIKDGELVHIECQSWWGPARADEEKAFERLRSRFDHAPKVVFDRYSFLDRQALTARRVFVTGGKPKRSTGNGPWDRLEGFCIENGIELVEVNKVIEELISELRMKYPKDTETGREVGIARFLLHLIHNDFLK